MINKINYGEYIASNSTGSDYAEYISEHIKKNISYSEYIAKTLGNYGASGTCGATGVSGASGTCGHSGSSGTRNIFDATIPYSDPYLPADTALTYATYSINNKLPILKDLELIPIKKSIKIQNSGLYGLFDNSKFNINL